MNETQVNSQAVINSLVRQIADQAQKIAFLEAFVETLQAEVGAVANLDVE
jgi:hypothetical protein